MSKKGDWIKIRKRMKPYPETSQQTKVKIGGLMIRELCKGLKAPEFLECRNKVLECAFGDKCDVKVLELKRKLKKELEG